MKKRVVVTGTGVVSPLGCGTGEFWSQLSQGKSGIRSISLFDTADFDVKFAGEISDFDPSFGLRRKPPRSRDRAVKLAFVAAAEALRQSGLTGDEDQLLVDYPVATIIGTGHGPCHEVELGMDAYYGQGLRAVNPMTIPRSMYNAMSSNLSIHFGLQGPNHVLVSACSSTW